MALLTAKERQNLDRRERRNLRQVRRARKPARTGKLADFDISGLRKLAAQIILDQNSEQIPGHERMSEVLDELAGDADQFIKWSWAGPAGPILELIDGPVIRGVVRAFIAPLVQDVYDHLNDAGMLDQR